jgi:hypothetical protein
MFFKHSWLRHLCLKIIPTRPLRHVWPEVVIENHTHTPAVHGKSHIAKLFFFEGIECKKNS